MEANYQNKVGKILLNTILSPINSGKLKYLHTGVSGVAKSYRGGKRNV